MGLAQRAAWLLAAPWRLVALVAVVAALPILVAGELAAADTTARHELAAADTARRAAVSAAASLADRVSAISLAVGNAATRAVTGRATPLIDALDRNDVNAAQIELEEMHRFIDPAARWLLVLDPRSRLIAVDPFARGLAGTDLSARIAPTRGSTALEVGDAFAWSDDLTRDPSGTGAASGAALVAATSVAINVTAPIGTTQPLGYRLVAVIRLNALAGRLTAQLRTAYQDAYLVDRGGHLALRASRAFTPDDLAYRDLSGSPAVASLAPGVADPLAPERVVRGVARVPDIGWSVLVVDTPSAIDADLEAALGQQRALRVGLAGVLLLGAALVGSASSTAMRRRRETTEALEQQTATAEVLKTISRSAFDLQAVFDVVVENATKLCRGEWGYLFRKEGDVFRLIATHGGTPALIEYERAHPTVISNRTLIGRVALRRGVVHIPDLFKDPDYDWPTNREYGVHTVLGVPIFRGDEVVGAIGVARNERRPFSAEDIRLVQTFADQATIAIENVRLFNETNEALAQQTALSEVLNTISRSAFDLDAVLQTIVERAAALCQADGAAIYRRVGDIAIAAATFGDVGTVPGGAIPISDRTVVGRAMLTGDRQYIPDARQHPDLPQDGPNTRLNIPFVRDGVAIGALSVLRRVARPFSDSELRLFEVFADQAAIAIENVRLFNETKDSLEQQTALGEVLRTMASSPADLGPVLDAIARNAARFCAAEDCGVALLRADGLLEQVAQYGPLSQALPPWPVDRGSVRGRAIVERRIVHVEDMMAESEEEYPTGVRRAREVGQRTVLAAPLLREGIPLGAIALRRTEVKPFTERQIELLRTFADQAAIAIENVRLFNETKEALERQTATSSILNVISRSPADQQPTLDAIVESGARLCDADMAFIYVVEQGFFKLRAGYKVPPAFVEYTNADPIPVAPNRGSLSGRVVAERRAVQIPDVLVDAEYAYLKGQRLVGYRSMLNVPMFSKGELIGLIGLWRTAPVAFTAKQIDLMSTFADQAVIAIENTRLFNETKEALERQTSISDVLQTIGRSAFDLQPVLDTVVERAVRLCDAHDGSISTLEESVYRTRSYFSVSSLPPEYIDFMRQEVRAPERGSLIGRTALDGRVVQIADVLEDPEYKAVDMQQAAGYRTVLGVPLLRDGRVIGVFALTRNEVRPFTDRQIELVRTFADQAAIAIENTRLFVATKEALEQQTAVGEVLKTISQSAFDLQPVLDIVLNNAVRLAGADIGWLSRVENEQFMTVAYSAEFPQSVREVLVRQRAQGHLAGPWVPLGIGGGLMGFTLAEGRTVHLPDVKVDPELKGSVVASLTASRTVVGVPMLRDGRTVGGMVLARYAVRPFAERELELVQTFADQAAIAIENVRLFSDIQDKSRQLEVASRHKSEFLANMSHELRTPLNAIIGFSEVLMQGLFGDVNEKQREYLQDVVGSGQHLLSLINDILDLSKIEAGRMELELSSFSFSDALASGVTIVRERASRHNITLSVVSDELGQVEADERKVKQILYNLLSNAVKFTPDGGRVEVSVRRDNGDVRVEVRDNGIGIAEADQARIFEEFQQVGRERSREGTGLGLTLTKRFVELHGGRIWLESAPGKGSTFAFTLPLRQAAGVRA